MIEILDHAVIDELRQLDPDGSSGFLGSIIEVFDTQCDELLPELIAAAASGDPDAIAKKAHKLKGSARTIGAAQVGELCQALEHAARAGPVSDGVDQVERIRQATEDVRVALKAL
jgi:HPt (histidine-containing phosphotransfer) domain-containing protein